MYFGLDHIRINIPNELILTQNKKGFFLKVTDKNGIEKSFESIDINGFAQLTYVRCTNNPKESCLVLKGARKFYATSQDFSFLDFGNPDGNLLCCVIFENNNHINVHLINEVFKDLSIDCVLLPDKCDINCNANRHCSFDKRVRRTVGIPKGKSSAIPISDGF